MDAREIGEKILREAGVGGEALRAKRNIDARLEGLGLEPSVGAPLKLSPGEEFSVRPTPNSAVSALLFDQGGAQPPVVVLASDAGENEEDFNDAMFEPSDLIAAQAVTALATTAAGGTEVRFNLPGFVHIGSGGIGVYYNRALGASQNFRWAPCAPNLIIPYNPRIGLFVGTNVAGGIAIGGALTLSFYRTPPEKHREKRDGRTTITAPGRGSYLGGGFREQLGRRVGAVGSDGSLLNALAAGPLNGTDVTLGTFSDAGAGTQIYKVSTNFPVGGAAAVGAAILNASPANTDVIWVGETALLAVASNGGLSASGQDAWHAALSGKLFMLANSGTQVLGVRYRS